MAGRSRTTTARCVSSVGSLYAIKSEEFLSKMSKDSNTWNLLTNDASGNDNSLRAKIKKASKDIRGLKVSQPNSPVSLDEELAVDFTDTTKNYLSIIDRNNLRMTDDRIADFRATL